MTTTPTDTPGNYGLTPVTSYTELIGAIREQVGVLGVNYEDFDVLAGFATRLSGKVFGPCQTKRLGPEKLFDALRASGLRLSVEQDPEQTARMQAKIKKKLMHPRQANKARMANNASRVGTALMSRCFKHLSRLGNEARNRKMGKDARSESARHAANTRWKRQRKAMKKRARQRIASHKRRQTNEGALV